MSDANKKINELLTDDSFIQWIEGKAPTGIVTEWESWVQDDPARQELVEQAKTFHHSFKFQPRNTLDVEQELSEVNNSIDEMEAFERKWKEASMRRRSNAHYFVYAAVILILLAVVGTAQYVYNAERTIPPQASSSLLVTTTNYGQKKKLTLSDGSTIILNANSCLKYPANYSGGNLKVWLKGEAYFNIVHKMGQDRRKFSVYTTDGKIEVFGTKFNVNTYNKGTEVVLVSGKVRVSLKDKQNLYKASYLMQPGERSQFKLGGMLIQSEKVNLALYTSWTHDELFFDKTPLKKIVRRIEHIYGVQFLIDDSSLKEIFISGSIPSNNLPVLLKAIDKMLDYKLINNEGKIYLISD